MRRSRCLLACLLFALPALAGRSAEPPLRVAALHTVLAEIAREIGGADVVVSGLVAAGVDPHTYDPTPRDLATVMDADLVLGTGLHLEGYLERLAANPRLRDRLVLVGEALPVVLAVPAGTGNHGHDRVLQAEGGEPDPHWWHGIDHVLFVSDLVRQHFARLRPAAAAAFAARAQTWQQKLFALKAWTAAEVAKLPPARRHLVTTHDAFGYLARDWGFTVHAIAGLSTDAEPDPKHLAELVKLVRRLGVKAVFAEGSASPRLAQALAAEAGAKLGGTLHADGLAPAGSGAETYTALMRHNISAIVAALR